MSKFLKVSDGNYINKNYICRVYIDFFRRDNEYAVQISLKNMDESETWTYDQFETLKEAEDALAFLMEEISKS